ncbi:MAG: hypothetical protein M1820_005982 [Bogoriella megaspora]|nr:MAG: hypothetical protein M1820_005982 [Bogoriella megaspora]
MALAPVEAALSVVGIISDVMGLVSSSSDDYPSQSQYQTTVRVGLGMSADRNDGSSLGGSAPGAAIWADDGSKVGYTEPSGDKIDPSGYTDVKIDQGSHEAYPTYLVVAAGGNDAICISYISMTDSQQNQHAWLGDIGYRCGAPWYHSVTRFGPDDYQPRCTWIDGDHSGNIVEYAMGMHITDFAQKNDSLTKEYQENIATMCGTKPRWAMYPSKWSLKHDKLPTYNPALSYNQDGSDKDESALWTDGQTDSGDPAPLNIPLKPVAPSRKSKRDTSISSAKIYSARDISSTPSYAETGLRARGSLNGNATTTGTSMQTHPDSIVITKLPHHSIHDLCTHPNSKGPSMVNLIEGLFCDMGKKKIWPTCSGKVTCGCLDVGDSHGINGTLHGGIDVVSHGNGTVKQQIGTATQHIGTVTHLNGTVVSHGMKMPHTRPACGKHRRGVEGKDKNGAKADVAFKNIIDWTH